MSALTSFFLTFKSGLRRVAALSVKSAMSSYAGIPNHCDYLQIIFLFGQHLQWIKIAHIYINSLASGAVTQCPKLTSEIALIADAFTITAEAHVCIWTVFSLQASNDRMFIFVNHYGINLPDDKWQCCGSTNIPIHLKSSCNYSKWGGAKRLVWLNTEDLESATLIWEKALDWLLAGSRYNLMCNKAWQCRGLPYSSSQSMKLILTLWNGILICHFRAWQSLNTL